MSDEQESPEPIVVAVDRLPIRDPAVRRLRNLLEERFPGLFDFNAIRRNFAAMLSGDDNMDMVTTAFEECMGMPPRPCFEIFPVLYDHEGPTWRCTVVKQVSKYRGAWHRQLQLKLANDGFFYPQESALNVARSCSGRHANADAPFVQLDDTELGKVQNIVDFALDLLDPSKCQPYKTFFYYSEVARRMDIKVACSNIPRSVLVTFEPGIPERWDGEDAQEPLTYEALQALLNASGRSNV